MMILIGGANINPKCNWYTSSKVKDVVAEGFHCSQCANLATQPTHMVTWNINGAVPNFYSTLS